MAKKNKKAIAKEFGTFLRLYGRKAQKGCEPNDRRYDPEIEHELRRLKPEEIDTENGAPAASSKPKSARIAVTTAKGPENC